MFKFHNFDIVFQEIPDETTLAINITGCPFRCEGCHSPHLREDIGEPLDQEALRAIWERYGQGVTCVCLMGGDADPAEVQRLSIFIRSEFGVRTGWYSGADEISPLIDVRNFDYIKIGGFRRDKGGLKHETTNQRLYAVRHDGTLHDMTPLFHRKRVFE